MKQVGKMTKLSDSFLIALVDSLPVALFARIIHLKMLEILLFGTNMLKKNGG